MEFEELLKPYDLSWIVPDEVIAFSSPQDPLYCRGRSGYTNRVRSEDLIDDFKHCNVKGIVRLNDKLYDAKVYERQQIKVHEMEFPDGSCPED